LAVVALNICALSIVKALGLGYPGVPLVFSARGDKLPQPDFSVGAISILAAHELDRFVAPRSVTRKIYAT
jgi:hypothetical protein